MRLTIVMLGITVLDLTVGPVEGAGNDDVADVLTTAAAFGFTPECRYDVVPGGET